MIICKQCREHLDATEVDEYVPEDYEDGIAIPYENIPKGKEVHIWMDIGNLFMHFVEGETSP